MAKGKPSRGLFSRSSYDQDAPEYTSVPTASAHHHPQSHPTSDDSDEGEDHHDVLREEEEREKLLSSGLLSGAVKIGKKIKGGRRKAVNDVSNMMGGKRLGMEEGGEYGIGSGDEDTDFEESLDEKEMGDHKPRKPSLRRVAVFSALAMAFLMMLIFASLSLSAEKKGPGPPELVYSNGTHQYHKTTILISLDGMRADFLDRGLTPTLNSFARSGVSPKYMLPSFPSVTFPNHWTIATGLYPEAHGVVGNSFWDPDLKKEFYYTDPARSMQSEWWGGDPIWATAERQGLQAAVHMWPGSEAPGWGATIVDKFNSTEVLPKKVDRILAWLDMPVAERPQLIAAYVPDVDSSGHKFGPNATETDEVVKKVDGMLKDLFDGIESRNLTDIVNLIIVSDHGMASTSPDRLIYLDDIVDDVTKIERTDGWPLYGLRPFADQNVTEIYEGIKKIEQSIPESERHWDVYLRDLDMPKRYHFTTSHRIAPLWIVPETGYAIITRKEFPEQPKDYHPKGIHGYDNLHPLMRAIFVARGPAFSHLHGPLRLDAHIDDKTGGSLVEPFGNWEVYRILCQTLGIEEWSGGSNATLEQGIQSFKILEKFGEKLSDHDSDSDSDSDDEKEKGKEKDKSNSDADSDSDDEKEEKKPKPKPDNASPTLSSTPPPSSSASTPTSSSPTPDAPIPSRPTIDDDEGKDDKPHDKTWWDFMKWRAQRLKEGLEHWWDSVWVDGVGATNE